MMRKANFYDISVLIKIEPKAWIVSKNNPNVPIDKIEISDFNLFKSGVLKSQGNRIDFNGKTFWLSREYMNKLKIKAKNLKLDISNLGISMQEFLNSKISKNLDFKIDNEIISSLVNSDSDIYIICSKNKKEYFENQISKLEEEVSKIGKSIKSFYYVSDSFFTNDPDMESFVKVKILTQHLIGLRSESNILVDDKITRYDRISYFDDDVRTITMCSSINSVLDKLMDRSTDYVKNYIRTSISQYGPEIEINQFTHNRSNKFITINIQILYPDLIKKFENFNHYFPYSSC